MTLDPSLADDERARAARLVPALRTRGRQRRRRRRASVAVAAAAVVAVGIALPLWAVRGGRGGQPVAVVGPSASPTTTPVGAAVTTTPGPAGAPADHAVRLGRFRSPEAYRAASGLYLSEATVDGPGPPPDRLLRLDPATGAVEASLCLGASEDAMLLVGARLWVTTTPSGAPSYSNGVPTDLLALDPSTLAVEQRVTLPSGDGSGRTLADAGGRLWVADGSMLVRVAPTGVVTAAVEVRGAVNLSVTTDGRGTTLVVGEGLPGGGGRIQRRDPSSGRLITQTTVQDWVGSPTLSTVVDGGIWIAFSTGMQGGVERIDASTLTTTSTRLGVTRATNGINAVVAYGRLFVTQVAGGRDVNFCGLATTGRPEAAPAIGFAGSDRILTADAQDLYVTIGGDPYAGVQTVERLPISPGCRV